MTYLEALRRKLGVETIDEAVEEIKRRPVGNNRCPESFKLEHWREECPEETGSNCLLCWMREYPGPIVHEEVETIYPCTVQILRNPKTGEESVGWFRGQMDGE